MVGASGQKGMVMGQLAHHNGQLGVCLAGALLGQACCKDPVTENWINASSPKHKSL